MKIAIGPVFDEFGGVSQHIFGIKRYSSHDVRGIPSKPVRATLNSASRMVGKGWGVYQRSRDRFGFSNYDVVHSHANAWFSALCHKYRSSTCKWVHTYHTLYFPEDYPTGLNVFHEAQNDVLLKTASQADVKICISHWLHDYLLENYAIDTEVVPNGVDVRACESADRERFIKKWGLRDFVLFLGYIDPIKNPQLFVELATRMPEVPFVMIGRNLTEERLEQMYKIKVPKNLSVIGEMGHADALDAMAACSAYVMTSRREGIPTALLEAMSLAKPVVVPAHYGCKEVVYSDEFGFMYEPGSLEDLIDKMDSALCDGQVRINARQRILSTYDWRVVAAQIDKIYASPRQQNQN